MKKNATIEFDAANNALPVNCKIDMADSDSSYLVPGKYYILEAGLYKAVDELPENYTGMAYKFTNDGFYVCKIQNGIIQYTSLIAGDNIMVNGEALIAPYIIEATETMQTSTLPSVAVPKISKAQLDTIITCMGQGRTVAITYDHGIYNILEVCLIDGQNSVSILYCKMVVEYVENGEDSIVAEYINLVSE